MLPSGLWKALGADTDQLRAILKVRLLMDNRKPLTLSQRQRKPSKFSLFIGMFLSFVFGIVYVAPFAAFNDLVTSMTVYYGLFLFLLTFSLVSDFSTALVDTRDKAVVLPRPVNDRTLLLSRLLHIFLYLFRTVVPMMLPGWIVAGIIYGWKAALFFPVPMLCTVLLSLFFVMGLYLVLLRFTKPGKFKEVLGYFQIAFSIILFASVYLLPRFMERQNMEAFHIAQHPGIQWSPSFWLAAMWSWLGYPAPFPNTLWLGLMAFFLPLLCLWITARYLAPQFSRKIASIDGVEPEENPGAKVVKQKKGKLYLRLASFFNRSEAANAGFRMTWIQTGRSRAFRMRVYPALAYIPMYFVYLLTMNKRGFSYMWSHLPSTKAYILLLYMCSFVMMQAVYYITVSEQYKAAWIYYTAPVDKPGRVMAGAFKVVWVKYFLPFFILVSIFVLYVWGTKVIPDILLALVNVTLFALIITYVAYRQLPFSILDQMNSSGNKVVRSLISMLLPFALGGAHYAVLGLPWFFSLLLRLLLLLLSCILFWVIWDSYLHTSWDKMKSEETTR